MTPMRRSIPNPKVLTDLKGKRLVNVIMHNSHGDVMELVFEDASTLSVCTTHGLMDKTVEDDPNDLYILVNGEKYFKHHS
jgi:hypothetical protein